MAARRASQRNWHVQLSWEMFPIPAVSGGQSACISFILLFGDGEWAERPLLSEFAIYLLWFYFGGVGECQKTICCTHFN